jgi:hypothetical protein
MFAEEDDCRLDVGKLDVGVDTFGMRKVQGICNWSQASTGRGSLCRSRSNSSQAERLKAPPRFSGL